MDPSNRRFLTAAFVVQDASRRICDPPAVRKMDRVVPVNSSCFTGMPRSNSTESPLLTGPESGE